MFLTYELSFGLQFGWPFVVILLHYFVIKLHFGGSFRLFDFLK